MLLSNESIVSEFRSSAMTQDEFCKQHNISIEKLRYYLYKKKPAIKKASKIADSKKSQPSFVCLKRDASVFNDAVIPDEKTECTIIYAAFTIAQLHELTGKYTGGK